MKTMKVTEKLFMLLFAAALSVLPLSAQIDDKYKDYREVYRDTITADPVSRVLVEKDTLADPHRIVANGFGKNWFLFGTVGAHSFRGDYSNWGPFKGTVSPDWSVGVGKWFMPWLGLKVEFTKSNSRGYVGRFYLPDNVYYYPYGYGDERFTAAGDPYKLMKTGWWDIGASAILNLTRMYYGYEGNNSRRLMNQFMLNVGLGGVHHTGYARDYGSDNELSFRTELQYSRFFTPAKRVSLDLKVRSLIYQTNFDLQYGQNQMAARKFDANLGVHLGFTLYLGDARSRGWRSGTSTVYRDEFREREIHVVKVKEVPIVAEGPVQSHTMTFFVFYPNNYSGRNDAPQIPDATVNALDYLAGGIFTQKQYTEDERVASRLRSGAPMRGLKAVDLPTERADQDFAVNFIPRGYEMLVDTPISLPLDAASMNAFHEKTGYYYAPIDDGLHVWNYRIDDATLRQQLLSNDNYKETASFGLNSHAGLGTIRQYMDVSANDELVSFADVYAAIKSNQGYIAQFADKETVDRINRILREGVIMYIQVEGLATSQDNYSADVDGRVGKERNNALAENRAQTVISWLTEHEKMQDVRSQIYLMNNQGGIRTVKDPSTRGLNAKLNRCVKVRIHYLMK